MLIRPNEIANVCALFATFRTRRMARHDLEGFIQKSLSLESDAAANDIIAACINCGILSTAGKFCLLTETGRELAKCHNETSPTLSEGTKHCLLRRVYLNPDIGASCCRSFLTLFHVDTVRGTFVYDRVDDEDVMNLRWMQLLASVGLLDVSAEIAIVREAFLPLFNDFLGKVRGAVSLANAESGNELNEVGDLAEEKAVEYEKNRLTARGYREFVCLVQRISRVDRTAGYDLLSCCGRGSTPEQPIHIEVKGTRWPDVAFVWSQNERAVAAKKGRAYWIYVYTKVNIETRQAQGPVRINNPTVKLATLGYRIEPVDVYVCKPSSLMSSPYLRNRTAIKKHLIDKKETGTRLKGVLPK